MNIDGTPTRTIRLTGDGRTVEIIDQTRLPHDLVFHRLANLADAETAIRDMWVRGAPLIGVTAAFGIALAMAEDGTDAMLATAIARLLATRPTAINLRWALGALRHRLTPLPPARRADAAFDEAGRLAEADVAINATIGEHGLVILRDIWARRSAAGATRLNVLTHCSAGWLATVDWGTALAPVYKAHQAGIPVQVWVDETRPRNQGAALTACELGWANIPHTVIVDNAGGHLMQHGMVDVAIVGSDRTTATGDVANKIGTYLKALAAKDNLVPFYVALPSSTIDWTLDDGVASIPIEERDPAEVAMVSGRTADGQMATVRVIPATSTAVNYGFDVTPARLVTGLITERGTCAASRDGLATLFPERRSA